MSCIPSGVGKQLCALRRPEFVAGGGHRAKFKDLKMAGNPTGAIASWRLLAVGTAQNRGNH